MFEVSTILEDDSAELVSGGANGLVNVSLSDTTTSSFVSTSLELSVEEEEDALAVSGRSRVAAKMRVDTALVDLKYSSNIG
ncbi:hypothetical protein Tco_0950356 [Tanacetum coccineum]